MLLHADTTKKTYRTPLARALAEEMAKRASIRPEWGTAAEASRITGIPKATMSRLMNGGRPRYNPETWRALCDYLNITMDQLLALLGDES
ncbi:MAG: helix-turn-helix domain-containing protein [bacterium]